ncbi:MAG: MATE family efflux transporter [Lachnospiraceae bacterium]|nr:MATE family efflux transporter [Lachnospiraceae bacterium]
MTQEEKVIYMTTEPVNKLVCKMAVPTIISMLITSFYNMADTYFVGKLNTQSTAAVGVVFSLMSLIQALGFFFGHGSGNYISRKLGAKEFEDASKMASIGFFSAFICGILVMLFGLIFLKPLSVLLGSTETILPYTEKYLSVILLGAPFMVSSLVLNNQLRFQGSASSAMVGIVSGAVLNIILDPILIFQCNMGITGAALATVIGQLAGFILLVIGTRKGENIHIKWKSFKPSFYYYKEVIRGGIPSLCRQGLASIATMCLNHMAGGFGDAAIAGMSIVSRISMFANSALIGFGQGFQPVCGMNYGAKLYNRVRDAFWFCVKYAFLFLIIVAVAAYIFAPEMVSLFRKDDKEVVEIGMLALRFQAVVFPLNAWIVLCNMMLQSIGKAVKASIVAAARQGLFFLPLILILPRIFGLTGIQICQMISDIFTFVLAVPLGISVLKEMNKETKLQESMEIHD